MGVYSLQKDRTVGGSIHPNRLCDVKELVSVEYLKLKY